MIVTIPRHLLIGKDGKVVSANAPRPGTPAIRQLIQHSTASDFLKASEEDGYTDSDLTVKY